MKDECEGLGEKKSRIKWEIRETQEVIGSIKGEIEEIEE